MVVCVFSMVRLLCSECRVCFMCVLLGVGSSWVLWLVSMFLCSVRLVWVN